MTIVFKVSDNIKEKMIKYYENRKTTTPPPYAIFQVKDYDCVTTLYESGKVMFQGIGADIEASIWTSMEYKLNKRVIDTTGKEKKTSKDTKRVILQENTIGSDEVGTGDYFGPIVVCASYVETKDFPFLTDLGVRDSKKLTDKQIMEIAPKIMERIPFKATILDNETYNKNYSENFNMNKIKAVLHNKMLGSLIKNGNYNYTKIVIDQFTPAKNYYGYISDVAEIVRNITFITKAEDKVLSVACSSIIARYYFLKEMKKIGEEVGSEVPFGAGSLVDSWALEIVKKKGFDYLKKIAKLNFKNTEKIKELKRSVR